LLGILLVATLAGCDLPSSQPAANAARKNAPSAELVARGRAVYNFRCYFCHGYSGDAKTLAASYLTPAPRNFQTANPETLPLEKITQAVRDGRPGTAMKGFREIIPEDEIGAVAAFVYDEFLLRRATNTRYHTPENGWTDHERYRLAFPFAEGKIPLTRPWNELTSDEQQGKRLYLASCVSCHDRGQPATDGITWDARPLSYPRNNYDHRKPEVDATTSATPYRLHEVPPALANLSALERQGEALFQGNCAFCHGADGTGKNWIGSFLEPHPRNLTDPAFMTHVNREHLRRVIREGLPNTSMPAWKSVLSAAEIDAVIAYINRAFHPVAN
jgi:cytochrome c oxidase cbb3-type subunit 3